MNDAMILNVAYTRKQPFKLQERKRRNRSASFHDEKTQRHQCAFTSFFCFMKGVLYSC